MIFGFFIYSDIFIKKFKTTFVICFRSELKADYMLLDYTYVESELLVNEERG